MDSSKLIYLVVALLFSGLVSFTVTPMVRVFAFRIGAIDVPRDGRRMHDHPIPRVGGLAIFLGFLSATMIFCDYSPALLALWIGGLGIVCMGVLDDIYSLHPLAKFAVQLLMALIAVSQGLTLEFITLFGKYYPLGVFSIPVTVLWIIGLTNAINLIDGLDGLSCGVSAICSSSLVIIMILKGDIASALVTAIIVGACLGFLPFNTNPAKIFMGDTGAQFLGYAMALISIQGLFKFHTLVSFLIPLSIFGLPLVDTVFAFFRRIFKGQNPFQGDRGHIHHRLIDLGFNQKQSVAILYAICAILGIAAILLCCEFYWRAAVVILVGFVILFFSFCVLRNQTARDLAGLDLHDPVMPEEAEEEEEEGEKVDLSTENLVIPDDDEASASMEAPLRRIAKSRAKKHPEPIPSDSALPAAASVSMEEQTKASGNDETETKEG